MLALSRTAHPSTQLVLPTGCTRLLHRDYPQIYVRQSTTHVAKVLTGLGSRTSESVEPEMTSKSCHLMWPCKYVPSKSTINSKLILIVGGEHT
jgi:hypothetical protein